MRREEKAADGERPTCSPAGSAERCAARRDDSVRLLLRSQFHLALRTPVSKNKLASRIQSQQ